MRYRHFHKTGRSRTVRAFTLVEMLVVVAIMGLMIGIATLAMQGLKTGGDFTKNIYQISSLLEQARNYALANNTYVYMGISCVDATQSVPPSSTQSDNATGGRVVIMIAAAKKGLNYDGNGNTWSTSGGNATGVNDLTALSKLTVLDNLQLAQSANLSTTGGMAGKPTPTVDMGGTSGNSATKMNWPLTGTAQYNFTKVIQFDAQGVARIQTSNTTSSDAVSPLIEFAVQASRGNSVPANAAQAAIQLSGISGATRIYRP